MTTSLTADQQAGYERDGILFPLPAIEPQRAATGLDRAVEYLDALGPEARVVDTSQVHLFQPWAFDLAIEPSVLDAVEGVLGPDLVVWATTIFAKPPHDRSWISWHQDATYWGLDTTDVTTAWIALSDSRPDNGGMRVVPGTHTLPIQPHVDTFAEDNLLSRGQEVQVEVNESDAWDVELSAGEMSLHHVHLVHGSNANRSDRWRIGFAIRYVTPSARQAGESPTGVLARGRDEFGHFHWVSRPPARSSAEAITAQREFNRDFLAALMPDAETGGS